MSPKAKKVRASYLPIKDLDGVFTHVRIVVHPDEKSLRREWEDATGQPSTDVCAWTFPHRYGKASCSVHFVERDFCLSAISHEAAHVALFLSRKYQYLQYEDAKENRDEVISYLVGILTDLFFVTLWNKT